MRSRVMAECVFFFDFCAALYYDRSLFTMELGICLIQRRTTIAMIVEKGMLGRLMVVAAAILFGCESVVVQLCYQHSNQCGFCSLWLPFHGQCSFSSNWQRCTFRGFARMDSCSNRNGYILSSLSCKQSGS